GVDRQVDGQLGVVAGADAGRALGVPVGGGAAAGAVPLVAARAVPVVAGSAGTVAGVAAGAVAGAAVAGVVVTGVVVAAGGARGAAVRLAVVRLAVVRLAVVLVLRHVRALVAERRVESGDHVDRVAADVDRDVHRGLDVVAGHDARRALRGAFRLRVGEGGAAAQGQNARRGCRRDHSLAQGLSQCLVFLLEEWWRSGTADPGTLSVPRAGRDARP